MNHEQINFNKNDLEIEEYLKKMEEERRFFEEETELKIQKIKEPVLKEDFNKQKEIIKIDYQPFDPELELKNILKLPKEEKKEALKKYRKELIKQKEGIAKLEQDLESEIKSNPDKNADGYFNLVKERAKDLKLSEKQISLFKKVLEEYQKRHQNIKEVLNEYKDPKELFKSCFGKEPEGKIEIIETPIMIYFRCHNVKDFAYVYLTKTFQKDIKSEDLKVTEADINKAKNINGMIISESLLKKLNNCIALENTGILKEREGAKYEKMPRYATLLHEEQHIIHKLINDIGAPSIEKFLLLKEDIKNKLKGPNPLNEENISELTKYFDISKEEFIKKIKEGGILKFIDDFLVKKFLNNYEKYYEDKAKNEILAHFKVEKNLDHFFNLMISKLSQSSYNFFSETKKEELFKNLKKSFNLIDESILKQKINDIENKYRKKLELAFAVLDFLQEKKGLTRKEIIGLLILEPLNSWPKLVARMESAQINPDF